MLVVAVAAGGTVGVGCQGATSVLDPAGPRAALDAHLWWVMLALASAVYVVVLVALVYALRRSGSDRPREDSDAVDDRLLILGGGIALPLLVLPIVLVVTLRGMVAVADPPAPPRITVDVVGHQWWYEVRYPDHGVRLVNEMRIPVGEPVRLRVTSSDVIHSFWVPRLMGKIDMLPGTVNERWIVASEPGAYLVECGEFCGLLHARMQMQLTAMAREAFDAWLADP